MAREQQRSPWRTLLFRASLCLVCATSAGCETTGFGIRRGSFFITGDGMDEGFQRWREHASPEDQAVIDELMARKDVEIHIVLASGALRPETSRGGASTVGRGDLATKVCPMHLMHGIPWKRIWHVAYDPERTQAFEKQHDIPTPIEVVLYHEIFGHVLFWLSHPDLLDDYFKTGQPPDDPTEPGARVVENKYRKRIGVPQVQEQWFRPSPP